MRRKFIRYYVSATRNTWLRGNPSAQSPSCIRETLDDIRDNQHDFYLQIRSIGTAQYWDGLAMAFACDSKYRLTLECDPNFNWFCLIDVDPKP